MHNTQSHAPHQSVISNRFQVAPHDGGETLSNFSPCSLMDIYEILIDNDLSGASRARQIIKFSEGNAFDDDDDATAVITNRY